jgi:hypothetical protein
VVKLKLALSGYRSVIQRLQQKMPDENEYQWSDNSGFEDCFVSQDSGLKYLKERDCFTVIDE